MMMKSFFPLSVFPFSPPFAVSGRFSAFFVFSHVLPGHTARDVPASPNHFLI
jgi:hypothetical protein